MGGFLIDTCVLSESRKRRPNPGVLKFLADSKAAQLYLSVLTIGEMRKGIAKKRLTDPETADKLAAWAYRIETDFADRIIEVDSAVAQIWGELSATGRPPVIDTLIAAAALARGLIVVTRNTKDFRSSGAKLLNPWSG